MKLAENRSARSHAHGRRHSGGWRLARFVIAIHTTHAQVGPLRKLDKRFRLPSPAATDL